MASDRVGHVVADGDFEFSGFGNVLCPFGGDHIPVGTVSSRIFIVERIYFPSGGGGVFPGRKGEATLFLSWDIDIKAYCISSLVYAASELLNWFKFTRRRPKTPDASVKAVDDIEDAQIIE